MPISDDNWLAGVAVPDEVTVQIAVSLRRVPLAAITIRAVTRQLRPEGAAVMLFVLRFGTDVRSD